MTVIRLEDIWQEIAAIKRRQHEQSTEQHYVVTDASGNVRAELGLLGNGDYGALVTDPLGNTEEILPRVDAYYDGQLSTTAITPTALTNTPSVTAVIGPSGDVLVEIGSQLLASPGSDVNVSLAVTDVTASGSQIVVDSVLRVQAASSNSRASVFAKRRWSTWPAGQAALTLVPGHQVQFTTLYWCAATGQALYASQNFIEVQPL